MGALGFFGLQLYRIRGRSMSPTLPPDTYVLLRHYSRKRRPQTGDICVFKAVNGMTMVKRLMHKNADGRFGIRGDGALSTPSIDLSPIAEPNMIGRVVYVI